MWTEEWPKYPWCPHNIPKNFAPQIPHILCLASPSKDPEITVWDHASLFQILALLILCRGLCQVFCWRALSTQSLWGGRAKCCLQHLVSSKASLDCIAGMHGALQEKGGRDPMKSIGRSTTKDKPKARENSYRRGKFTRLRTLVLGDLMLTPQCRSSASLSRSLLTAREILRAAATPDGYRRPCYPCN